MAEYRLNVVIGYGEGTITIDGVAPVLYYEEGTTLTIATTLANGFVSVEWFESPDNTTPISSATSFSYVMPAKDTRIRVVMSGTFAPIDGYGLKYFYDYGSIEGNCKRLEIYQDTYGGLSTEINLGEVVYGFGNIGDDPLKTIVGSYLDFEIVGGVDDFAEFLEGDNRTFQVRYYDEKDDVTPFFVGYISPDFITTKDLTGNQIQKFTAIDGLKGFDSIRATDYNWIASGSLAYQSIIGALNQSFVQGRSVNFACDVHETRMNSALNLFTQFRTPANAIYNDGKLIEYSDGVRIINDKLFLKNVIERLVNPFLCKVFLWRNEFYVVRIGELEKAGYTTFKYDSATISETGETVTNGLDIECDINNPEKTARRVFTEFTAILNLGVLDLAAQGAIIEVIDSIDDWTFGSAVSAYPNIYRLRRFEYVRAIPSGQPTSVPSGNTALIQYDTGNEAVKIWSTTSTSGLSDTNISWISIGNREDGLPLIVAQETANTIGFSFEYMALKVGSGTPDDRISRYQVGYMLRVGDYYLEQTGANSFAFTLTETVVTIDLDAFGAFNTYQVDELLVPVDGDVEFRFYQLIAVSSTINEFAVDFRNLKLSIEENDALTLNEISVKGITDSIFSNVHPDYETFIGDAETNNSSSAIILEDVAGDPVSELWSRDGIEQEPLMDIIVQDIANLKGTSNLRILGTVERVEIKPYQSVLYNGKYYMVIAIQYDTYRNRWKCELFELAPEPTT